MTEPKRVKNPRERQARRKPVGKPEPVSPRIVPDWRAYFVESFVPAHGGEPQDDGLRLIFRDGWTYSRLDYRGPETQPPRDERELRSLQMTYWLLLKHKRAARRDLLFESVRVMKETSQQRSAPLRQTAYMPDDHGRITRVGLEVDYAIIEKDMEQANTDVAECDRMIRGLSTDPLV